MSELRQMRKSYPSLQLELQELQQQKVDIIKNNTVTDTVLGSSIEYPYTSHPVSVEGFMQTTTVRKQIKAIDTKINSVIASQNYVEKVITGVTDNLVRYAIRQYIIGQKTWTEIYCNLDAYCESATVDALRKRVEREIKKIKKF